MRVGIFLERCGATFNLGWSTPRPCRGDPERNPLTTRGPTPTCACLACAVAVLVGRRSSRRFRVAHIRVCNRSARRDQAGNPATKTNRVAHEARSRQALFLLRARAIFENPPPSPSNRQPPSLANVARTHGLSMPCASSVLEITCVNEMTSSPPTACRAGVGDRPSVRSRVSQRCWHVRAGAGTCGAGTHASERSTWTTSRERQTECAATQAYAGMQWGGD